MLFVAQFKGSRNRSLAETTQTRLTWNFPENLKVLSEYWCANTSIGVILVFETDDPDAINAATNAWADDFDIEISPAVTGEHGMELARQSMH